MINMDEIENVEVDCQLSILGLEPETNMTIGDEELNKTKKNRGSSLRCQFRCAVRFRDHGSRLQHYAVMHEGESLPVLTCQICGKSGFKWDCTLKQHITNSHSKTTGILMCEYCEKIFTRRDSFKEHLLIHEGPRHKCSHCDKEFVQRSNLIRHERIHTGHKPYKCTYCEAAFSDQGACKSHENIHTRLQTCVCTYCGQQFSKQQKLRYHLRKHTGEGLMKCDVCDKEFTNGSSLRNHKLTHENKKLVIIKCPYACGKVFTKEKNMKKHVSITHEKLNLHQCQICQRVLSAHTCLKNHMLVHTGVKHIICLLCKKSYSEMPGFRYHLLSKHNIARRHELFHNCYYKLTIKEIGLMEKYNKSRKMKKSKEVNDDELVSVSETIENILSGKFDTMPLLINDGEALFESVLHTDETVRRGGKTYLIAPERGIPVPEFYEKSATDKESLDKKINDKHKNVMSLIKVADLDDNIKTNKKSKLNKGDIRTANVTVSGTIDRVNDLLKEFGGGSRPIVVDRDDNMMCVKIPSRQFRQVIQKVLFDYYTTVGGTRLIRNTDNHFKIDNRGRPRGSCKNNNDHVTSLENELGIDIITITGSHSKIDELMAEITGDVGGELTKRAELMELADGTHVIKAERCELVSVLDKTHTDSYVTLKGIRLLYVNERTFKIDSRGRKKIKTEPGANLIGHVNENEEITVFGGRERLTTLAAEFGTSVKVTEDDLYSCLFHVSKCSFNSLIQRQGRDLFTSPNGVKLICVNESTFKIDSRGRRKKVVEDVSERVVVKEEFTKVQSDDKYDVELFLSQNDLNLNIESSHDKHYVNIPNCDFNNLIDVRNNDYVVVNNTRLKKLSDYDYLISCDYVSIFGGEDKLTKLINSNRDKLKLVKDNSCVKIKNNLFKQLIQLDDNGDNILLNGEVLVPVGDTSYKIEELVTINGVYCRITEFLELLNCDIKKIDQGDDNSFSITITSDQFDKIIVKNQNDVSFETMNGLRLTRGGEKFYKIIDAT